MVWTKAERKEIDAALQSLRRTICKRVQERELDQLKLARVAQVMDNWVRTENDAYRVHFDHLHKELSYMRAKNTQLELELEVRVTRLENALTQMQDVLHAHFQLRNDSHGNSGD